MVDFICVCCAYIVLIELAFYGTSTKMALLKPNKDSIWKIIWKSLDFLIF